MIRYKKYEIKISQLMKLEEMQNEEKNKSNQ